MFIGYYNYTVILTYGSLLSAMIGILVCLNGIGHPFYGVFFLLISGLCDTFDGRVASTKKDRSAKEKAFGMQIDSLADLVAFGVLPACIGMSMVKVSARFTEIPHIRRVEADEPFILYPILFFLIVLIYVLAALIRLAYFNVTEEERAASETGRRSSYTGLPVTSAALIFPTILLIQYLTNKDLTLVYFGVMAVVAVLFVTRFEVKKPKGKWLGILVAIGGIEFLMFLIARYILHLR